MAEDFTIFSELLLTFVADKAREAALAGEGATLARAHEEIGHSLRLANALNLDRRQTILDAVTVLGSAKSA
jgi:DNA polymerase III subunit delta'